MKYTFLLIIASLFLFAACNNKSKYLPKPRGYFRIAFSPKIYVPLNGDRPYRFEHPNYANITLETGPFSEPFWINVEIPRHNAKIHLSYKAVNNNLEQLINDSHDLVYKHSAKANAINEMIFENPEQQVYGTLFAIKGNAASPMQFHVTDSTHHFLRGSFYISETPNYDSLQPVIEFIEKDILHLIETLNWKR